MKLILASNSPRRRELLTQWGVPFEAVPSRYEEIAAGLSARATVLRFARGKAEEVLSRFPGCAVLGADTVVALGKEILGKPRSAEHAKEMLRALSGKKHSVYTGVCLMSAGKEFSAAVKTDVYFKPLSEALIGEYVASGKPLDKAGAYGIQDGYDLVARIEGDYDNVVGLPEGETLALLHKHGGIIC